MPRYEERPMTYRQQLIIIGIAALTIYLLGWTGIIIVAVIILIGVIMTGSFVALVEIIKQTPKDK